MKKLLFLLLMLPLGLFVASCDDDNKVPEVSVSAKVSGAVVDNGVIYVVKGETFQFESLDLVNNTGKNGCIGSVTYFLDGLVVGTAVSPPFQFVVDTENLPVGNHLISADASVYVVDYSVCWGVFQFPVKVVADESDLPGEPGESVFQGTIRHG